ncbi:MAG: hypothetical protein LQ338_004392 [Usnochroma carphineum]|nr:MAG: hypothetical protein LQ338_004392 [Usnochroma carphineum]
MDPYRAYYHHPSHRLPPPAPPPEMLPFPQRPQQGPANQLHHRGDSWRPPQGDFTFRNNASAPQYPRQDGHYQPSDDRSRHNNDRRGRAPNKYGWGQRRPTAERPLLSSKRGASPEDMLGQADAQNKPHRFLPAEDVSNSDDKEMEESDADQQPTSDGDQRVALNASAEKAVNDLDSHIASETLEPPTKRRATTVKHAQEAASVPQWSNPDPYTVLPPMDEMQRKRKDVVKIIRKARIVAEKEVASENQVAANDDFISFGLQGTHVPDDKHRSSSPVELRSRDELGVPGAPTGPRAFSHLNNLHSVAIDRAPGTSEHRPSASDLGPPPDSANGYQLRSGRNVSKVDLYPDQAEALGNRKRTIDDDIKGDVVPSGKKKKKAASNGWVLPQWIPRGNTDPTPWLASDHCATENPGFRYFTTQLNFALTDDFRLHKEICDFYEFVKPERHEQIIREDLLQRLQGAIKKQLPDCDLYCFGSFAAKMYLPNADMDLVVISSSFRTSGKRVACQGASKMHTLAQRLEAIGLASRGSMEVIPNAKVPLIKFIDQMTGIQVDVSFENETGLVANETFNAWKRQFPAMPILVTVIKQFLKMRGLSEVVNGGLGGFSVTCLVTSLLQNLPRVQSGKFIPEQHLGEMLLEFLDLYGNQFDLARTGISMDPPGYYDKVSFLQCHSTAQYLTVTQQAAERFGYRQQVYQGNRATRLAILDPNNRYNDISGGSKNISLIFDMFSEAHEEILNAMRSPNRLSLLDWTLGGDYRSFTVQRRRLQELYHSKWENFEPGLTLKGTQVPYPSMPVTDENRQRSTSSLTGLPGSMFFNPVDPGVVVQPKVKAPKPKKGKKNKAKKNESRLDSTNAQGNIPLLAKAAKLTGKTTKRARKLKAKFPSKAAEVPDTMTKQTCQKLLDNFTAERIDPIGGDSITARERKEFSEPFGQPKRPLQKPKEAQNSKLKPQLKPKAEAYGLSEAILVEIARHIGGAINLPIIID